MMATTVEGCSPELRKTLVGVDALCRASSKLREHAEDNLYKPLILCSETPGLEESDAQSVQFISNMFGVLLDCVAFIDDCTRVTARLLQIIFALACDQESVFTGSTLLPLYAHVCELFGTLCGLEEIIRRTPAIHTCWPVFESTVVGRRDAASSTGGESVELDLLLGKVNQINRRLLHTSVVCDVLLTAVPDMLVTESTQLEAIGSSLLCALSSLLQDGHPPPPSEGPSRSRLGCVGLLSVWCAVNRQQEAVPLKSVMKVVWSGFTSSPRATYLGESRDVRPSTAIHLIGPVVVFPCELILRLLSELDGMSGILQNSLGSKHALAWQPEALHHLQQHGAAMTTNAQLLARRYSDWRSQLERLVDTSSERDGQDPATTQQTVLPEGSSDGILASDRTVDAETLQLNGAEGSDNSPLERDENVNVRGTLADILTEGVAQMQQMHAQVTHLTAAHVCLGHPMKSSVADAGLTHVVLIKRIHTALQQHWPVVAHTLAATTDELRQSLVQDIQFTLDYIAELRAITDLGLESEGLGDYSDSDVECLQTLHAILSHKDSANWPPAVVLMLTTNVDKAAGCHGNRDEKTRQPSPQRRTRFGLTSRIEALLKVSHMEKTIQRCTDMCFLLWQRQLVRIYIKRTVTSTPQAKTDKRMTAKGDEQVGLNEGQRGVAVLSVLLGAVADGMGVCAHAQHIAPGLLIEQQHAHVVKVLDECLLQPLPKHVEVSVRQQTEHFSVK